MNSSPRILATVCFLLCLSLAATRATAGEDVKTKAMFNITKVQQLKGGDPVVMAGVQVGCVESIAFDPSGVETRVTMLIQRSVVVKTGSTATITSVATPGRSCIVLDSGSPGAPAALEATILKTREKPSS